MYFQNVYEAITGLGDFKRESDLLVGLERYHRFVRGWEQQPINTIEALGNAVDRFHAAVMDDMADSKVPRYPFAEYLYVHAATTQQIGIPQRAGQSQTKQANSHIGVHAVRAFGTRPYQCARWAHAMALQAGAEPVLLPEAWEKVKADLDADCERYDGTEKNRQLKKLAEAQLASAYFQANQWKKTIETRWPQVIQALGAVKQGNAPDVKNPPNDHQNLDHAEVLFEGGVDAMLMFDAAAQYHEVIDTTQRLVSFAEQDMRLLRDAVEKLFVNETGGDKKPISAYIDVTKLNEKNQGMVYTLSKCTGAGAASNDCEKLRETIRDWLQEVMDVSHQLSLLCLDQTLSTLEASRAYHCRSDSDDHASVLPECPSSKENVNRSGASTSALVTSATAPMASSIASAVVTSAPVTSSSATPANSSASPSHDSPVDLERTEIRKLLVQMNDIVAIAQIFRTAQQCKAPWDHSTPTLQELIEKADEVLNKSPLSPVMVSVLYECAFVSVASSSDLGKKLVEQHRHTTLLDAWSWEPPSAELAWKQEYILNQKPTLREAKGGEALKARLHYPGAWEVLGAHKDATWEPQPDKLKELARAAQQAFGKTKAWDEKEQREAIWTWVMTGADEKDHSNDLRTAMETVGKELWRGALRRDRPASDEASTCRPILALIACGTTEANELGKRPECEGLPKQRCPLDIEKDRYNGFGDPIPQSASEVATTIQTMYMRAMDAHQALMNQLSNAVSNVLTPFLNEATKGIGQNAAATDLTLPFAVLRMAAASRQLPGLSSTWMKLAPVMVQVIVNDIKIDSLTLLRVPDLVKALSGTIPFTHKKKLVQSEGEAFRSLDELASSPCWPKAGTDQEKDRWLRRFLSHVVLKQHYYQHKDPIDRAAFRTLELSTAYEAWCRWASDGQKPLVKDENILAFAWMWQVDGVGGESDALVDGDALFDYLVARKEMESGRPNKALYNDRGLDSGEGKLLRARAAVRAGKGGLALRHAFKAQQLMAPDGLGLFEGELMKTVGDARLLFATQTASEQGWQEFTRAIEAYKQADQNSPLIKRRMAAAYIEIHQPQKAADLVRDGQCWKDKWLLAIANRMKGIRHEATMRGLLTNPMYTMEDLPRQLGKAESDPTCALPVFIGQIARVHGRMLLQENR